ncbi:MAG: hypothetical protein MUP22_01980 [Desulfobacterales bacterium]|nr:hypothetical protein [Desulfobacterales bacterium]
MSLLKTISPENAEGEIADVYSFFTKSGLPVPKPLEMASASPGLLKIQNQLLGYYMNHPSLGFALLSLIRYLVAKKYNYVFCTSFNENFLKMQGMDEEQIKIVEKDPGRAPIEDKDREMLVFVMKAIEKPEAIAQKDMDALYNLGWTDRDIFDALNHGTGMIGPSILMKAFKMDTC